jgi:hypothetical protein
LLIRHPPGHGVLRGLLVGLSAFLACSRLGLAQAGPLPTTREVIDSRLDLWGEASLREPGGPSYAFFERLLPPLRYVDAPFLHYPIVLCAPGARVKTRFVSNGSAINARGRMPIWKNEAGVPIEVRVGDRRESFGADVSRLDGPRYAEGFLPIVGVSYAVDGERFGQECFASVDDRLVAAGTTLVRFDFPGVDRNRIDLRFEAGDDNLAGAGGVVKDASGKVLAAYDENWQWVPSRNMLLSKERHAASAYVVVFTQPIDAADVPKPGAPFHADQRARAENCWRKLLAAGTDVEVPESRVNDAWRSLILANYGILAGDQMNYSALNVYARQYAHESGEGMRAFLLWGHGNTAARTLPPLFRYTRKAIELHDGAFKLMDLADYYAVTRDAATVRDMRDLWRHEVDLIVSSRAKGADGLLPPEKYCSDIPTPVVSLSTNASCWRALRDASIVLEDLGEREEAERLKGIAAEYRQAILAAVEKSWVRTVDPPFLPLAPGHEDVHDPITATSLGGYWNLVINQFLNAQLLPPDAKETSDILRYIQTRGGLCMGMARFQSPRGTWVDPQNIDDLYTLRYALTLLRRDEGDRALITFYGKLAQGFTRDTFIDGEASGIVPLDPFGRQMGLPPNSTANASFLLLLRYLLVQEWDTSGDGRADELRLLFATPRRWLADGKQIKVHRAPTAFGEVSLVARSNLAAGEVTADVELPERTPAKTSLRFRLPDGWTITSATADERALSVSGGDTIALPATKGRILISAKAIIQQ